MVLVALALSTAAHECALELAELSICRYYEGESI